MNASRMAHRATEVAKAVNTLLDFSYDNQEVLLDVILDYFCEPDPQDEDEDNREESLYHEDGQATLEPEGTL